MDFMNTFWPLLSLLPKQEQACVRKPQMGLGFLASTEWLPMYYYQGLTQFLNAYCWHWACPMFMSSSRSGGLDLTGWHCANEHTYLGKPAHGPSWAACPRADLLTSLTLNLHLSAPFLFLTPFASPPPLLTSYVVLPWIHDPSSPFTLLTSTLWPPVGSPSKDFLPSSPQNCKVQVQCLEFILHWQKWSKAEFLKVLGLARDPLVAGLKQKTPGCLGVSPSNTYPRGLW